MSCVTQFRQINLLDDKYWNKLPKRALSRSTKLRRNLNRLLWVYGAQCLCYLLLSSFSVVSLRRKTNAYSCLMTWGLTTITSIGSFSNENVKTATGLLIKTTSLHVRHTFLYISLPLLHDYNMKIPNFMFYGGRKQAMTKFSFPF